MSHSLKVKAVLKPCGSTLDVSKALIIGKKLKEVVGWVGCIPCNGWLGGLYPMQWLARWVVSRAMVGWVGCIACNGWLGGLYPVQWLAGWVVSRAMVGWLGCFPCNGWLVGCIPCNGWLGGLYPVQWLTGGLYPVQWLAGWVVSRAMLLDLRAQQAW